MRIREFFVVLAATSLLASCAVGQGHRPSPSAETPSASPSPTAQQPESLEVSTTGVVVLDAGGVILRSERWDAEPERMIAFLTELFGPPTSEVPAGEGECFGAALYAWGNELGAFSLFVEPNVQPAPLSRMRVHLSAAEISEVEISTSDGFAVGDDISSLFDTLPSDQIIDGGWALVWSKSGEYVASGGQVVPFGGVVFPEENLAGLVIVPGYSSMGLC